MQVVAAADGTDLARREEPRHGRAQGGFHVLDGAAAHGVVGLHDRGAAGCPAAAVGDREQRTAVSARQLDPEVFSPELAGNLATMIQALIILFVGAELLIVYIWGLHRRVGFAGPARVQPELKA